MAGTQQAEVSGKHTAADFDAQLSHEFGKAYAKVQQIASQCEAENKAELLQLLLQMAVKVWNRSRHSDDKVYYCQAAVNLLQLLRNRLATLREISLELGYPETYELRRKIITPLIEFGYISMTNPEKPKSSKQAYRLSARGQRLFK